MAKAIFELQSGRIAGTALLGKRGDLAGSVDQETHDGATVNVRADRTFGVRFLGVDAPEISFALPGDPTTFVPIGSDDWKQFLSDPFSPKYGEFDPPLPDVIRGHLAGRTGPGTAENHDRHARAAQAALRDMIDDDIQALAVDAASFRFFMAFAHEVMDGYGRLLCYLNRDQPTVNRDQPTEPPPPKSYNERLLAAGWVMPYFIWPNLDPFDPYKRPRAHADAVPFPGSLTPVGVPEPEATQLLQEARALVRASRANHLGVFEQNDPLLLEPFELRFLARREQPDRFVIDLSSGGDAILEPHQYPGIAPEDRLFVPGEYLPLFESRGWKLM
jgi:endonuclease YncB( thermonuclease family)